MRDTRGRFVKASKIPARWALEITPENKKMAERWRTCGEIDRESGYILHPGYAGFTTTRGYWTSTLPVGIEKITTEQFKEHILGEKPAFPKHWSLRIKNLTGTQQAIVGKFFNENSGNICYTALSKFHVISSHNFAGEYILGEQKQKGASFADGVEYDFISFSEFEENVLKVGDKGAKGEKKVLGYLLKSEGFREAALSLAKVSSFGVTGIPTIDFPAGSSVERRLKAAGVLDIWFDRVYLTVFKVGDWITVEDTEHLVSGCRGLEVGSYKVIGTSVKEWGGSHNGLREGKESLVVEKGGQAWAIDGKFRLATLAEIKNSTTVTIKGYESRFAEDTVTFGCQTFSKEFVLQLRDFIKKDLLEVEYSEEICKVASFFEARS